MSEHIPQNWKTTPLGKIVAIVSGGTPSRETSEFWGKDIPWVTPTDITNTKERFLFNTAEALSLSGLNSSSASLLPAGTILMTSRATVGDARIAEREVCTNQGFKSLIPSKNIDSLFLFYQMQRCREAYKVYGIGSTFLEVSKKDTERFELLLPNDLADQQAISKILDCVDQAIEKTKALIHKYQQIKAGLMHDLFTRGLTADGKLRPPREQAPDLYQETPIGWIPKEWEETTLSMVLSRIDSGWSPACPETPPGIGEWGILKVSAVTKGFFDPLESKTLPQQLSPIPSLEVHDGDVILTRANGVAELVGKTVQVRNTQEKLMLSDKLLRLIPKAEEMINNYLALLMCSEQIKFQIEKTMSGSSGQRNISQSEIRSFSFYKPQKEEQVLIAERIGALETLIAQEKITKEKLKKQKSGLMHDLLTGKVPVKVAQAETAHV